MISAPRILIVEDEAVASMLLKKQLERLGYVVGGTAARGDEAIDCARHQDFDLVLMDIRLAGEMDGIQAAQGIRMIKKIPVIFLTGYQDEDILARALTVNPAAYLVKPVKTEQLAASIASVVGRSVGN
jgi:CheY-like chemotaxis protein